MNGILEFLGWCVFFALIAGIGFFVLQLLIVVITWLIVAIVAVIGWLASKLKKF